jgi:predicted ATPase/DNA-binding CsgD family transcriptional regulator/DNA-binding XRE family transcriptional regulator
MESGGTCPAGGRQGLADGIGASHGALDVRALRTSLHLTQEQLAHRLGVSFATVNRWEMGRRSPSASSRRRLESLLAATEHGDCEDSPCDEWFASLIVPKTPFVGREAELTELVELFGSGRLLSLVGPAGCGKTRLAVEVLRRAVSRSDAVTVVALEEVDDSDRVDAAVSVALGLRDTAGVQPHEQLLAYLARSRQVLVLDNCEHVQVGAKRFLETALAHAPDLRVLATSRRPLDVAAERAWRVAPLERSDAVRLFVERAQQRLPTFTLDARNTDAVTTICRRLDDLPLAIELAAAWSGVLSAAELADRLADGFALLDAPSEDDGKHRTLRAAVEWSDALLDPADRRALSRLSIFRGRFTAAEAAAVTAGEPSDVVFALRHLVESSWIVAELTGEDTTYAMLNTLRAYGRELLDRSANGDDARVRHAELFVALAESSEEALAGADQSHWRIRMEQSAGDLDAALKWGFEGGHIELGQRLVAALWRWWYTTGRLIEGRRWVSVALASRRTTAAGLQARLLYASAVLASENGDYTTAGAHGEAARNAFVAIGDHRGTARSSTVLGNIAKYRVDLAAAREHLNRAVASQRAVADERGTAVALQNLASLILDSGDLAAGREVLEESLALKRRIGDRRSLAYGLINLGDLLVREQAPDKARAVLAEAEAIAAELNDERLAAFVAHNLGDVLALLGEKHESIAHYRTALEGFRLVHDERDVALALCSLGRALLRVGERAESLALLQESETLAADLGDELRLSEARAALLAASSPPSHTSLPGGLTGRQAEILGLVSAGLSNRDIAARLVLSAGTVERHLANVYRKLGVSNRVGATRYALVHGLSSDPPAAPRSQTLT